MNIAEIKSMAQSHADPQVKLLANFCLEEISRANANEKMLTDSRSALLSFAAKIRDARLKSQIATWALDKILGG